MSSQRAESLRVSIEQRIADLFATLQPLDQEQWAVMCPNEGWPVGYVAHHIGQGIERPTGWIEQALVGDDPFEFSWDITHELNARRHQRLGLPSKEEALRFLRLSASHFMELVGSMSDPQFDRVGFRQAGSTRTIEWVVKLVMRHINEHHKSIRIALRPAFMPDDRTRLDTDLRHAYGEFEAAKFPRIRPRDWTVLDDVQMDLDLDGGDLAGMAETWLSAHKLGYPDIPLDETIDERLTIASSEDAEARDTIERFRSYRRLQLELARCLSAASGRPVRYWRR